MTTSRCQFCRVCSVFPGRQQKLWTNQRTSGHTGFKSKITVIFNTNVQHSKRNCIANSNSDRGNLLGLSVDCGGMMQKPVCNIIFSNEQMLEIYSSEEVLRLMTWLHVKQVSCTKSVSHFVFCLNSARQAINREDTHIRHDMSREKKHQQEKYRWDKIKIFYKEALKVYKKYFL